MLMRTDMLCDMCRRSSKRVVCWASVSSAHSSARATKLLTISATTSCIDCIVPHVLCRRLRRIQKSMFTKGYPHTRKRNWGNSGNIARAIFGHHGGASFLFLFPHTTRHLLLLHLCHPVSVACPKSGHVPSILKGMSQRAGLSQEFRRACPKSGHAPRILKGMSQERARQERACPKNFKWHVPRAGMSQERACPNNFEAYLPLLIA